MDKAMAALFLSETSVLFGAFPRLPFELRTAIWELVATNSPRVIHLTNHGTDYDIIEGGYLKALQQTTPQTPAILYVNSESRAVGLNTYKRWYKGNIAGEDEPGFATYVNPACDTLLITTSAYYRFYPTLPNRGQRNQVTPRATSPDDGFSLASSKTFPWGKGEAVFSICTEHTGWSFNEDIGHRHTYLLIKKNDEDAPLASKMDTLSVKMIESFGKGGLLSSMGGENDQDFLGDWNETWVRFRS